MRVSEGSIADFVACVPDAVIGIDDAQTVFVFNRAAEQMFGHRAADVIGRPVSLLLPQRYRAAHSEHIRGFAESRDTSRRLGRFGEIVGLRANGEEFAVQASIVRAETTGGRAYAAILREPADRRREEVLLRANGVRLDAIIAQASQGIVSVDEAQRILLFNRAAERMFGRAAKDVIGQPLDILLPVRFRVPHTGQVREFGRSGHTNRAMGEAGQLTGLRANGEEFPVRAEISQTGMPPYRTMTVVLTDVTDSVAAENALREYADRLQGLSRRLFSAREDERRRLARDLHDQLGETLAALTLNLRLVEGELDAGLRARLENRFKDNYALLAHTGELVRGVLVDLHPPGLDEFGLIPALREHARAVAARADIAVVVQGDIAARLGHDVEITLFRIAQESLLNAVRHAGANQVVIDVDAAADHLVLTIVDDGCGFDPDAELGKASQHLGILGMHERAESIEATLRLESTPGKGTRVILEMQGDVQDSARGA